MNPQIVPAILEPTKEKFDQRYHAVAPHVQKVQLDVLDGTFQPNIDFHDPEYIDKLNPSVKFEIHFMINNVLDILDQWNYDWVEKIIFHLEAEGDTRKTIDAVKNSGKRVSLAINPETVVNKLQTYLGDLDSVQVMTIHPGAMGTPFVPETIEKIKAIRQLDQNIPIEVDGAMSPQTIKLAVDAGANLIVSGGFIKNNAVKESLEQLKKAIAR